MAMKPNGDFPFFTGNSPVALYYCNRCRNGRLLDRKMRPSTIWSWSSMVMVLSSDFGRSVYIGYYNKRPSGNIKVQNLSMYVFGMAFSVVAIVIQDFDAIANNVGIRELIIIGLLNYYPAMSHLLSGIVVSMVMEYAENIVKVYLTTVALLLTAVVSVYLFNFHVSLAFFLGSSKLTAFAFLITIHLTFSHKVA
ncbi:unnamed protein product [Brassica napus]|uniref:Uncharacterized protein n=2 Tax=Brassica TaxID=3705 RepID=A0A3P6AMW5_BRAOL|nr:unnamed protein product [Brassica napus]VDC88684.1 unnamed protein product [Brassica oleracea]